jgi:hypothetical protein
MTPKYIIIFCIFFLFACDTLPPDEYQQKTREEAIPDSAVKMTPETDLFPPILHSNEYEEPIPMSGSINTAGAEDSPFIPINNDEFYFFFTPDVTAPVEEQLIDGATGIYSALMNDGIFADVKRVLLQDLDKLSLDGCTFVIEDTMWFCSAREGYTGLHWFTAEFIDYEWTNWTLADFALEYQVGELHIHGDDLYYHSYKDGGKGGTDIWMLTMVDGEWLNPINIESVNTDSDEGMPYITSDGKELWFNRMYLGTPAVFRSKKVNDQWEEPELIISQFAGEPTLDSDGNVYFVHHFFIDGEMIEADIYVAYNK